MRYVLWLACGILGLAMSSGPAQRKGRAFTSPTTTTPTSLWTADEATYERVFQEMIDYYLDLADATDANPAAYQSRFNCDGSYWLWIYEKHRTPAEFQRVIDRLRSGHLSAPMTTLVSCYGGQPTEAVLRGMYYAGRLERQHDVSFPLAVAMENQTLPLGLASLWAGAGAEYSWRGVCDCASRVSSEKMHRRPHEIYWYAGQDGQRVLMKWHSLASAGNKSIGGYAEAFNPAASIRYLTENADFLQRFRAPELPNPTTSAAPSASAGTLWIERPACPISPTKSSTRSPIISTILLARSPPASAR